MSEESEHSPTLSRDMGFLEAYTMGVGTMIGAGIFVLPSIAAANAGPASMISFVIGGFVSLLAALSLSELATGMPKAGGSYYYVNRSLGSFFGSIVGWGMWMGLMFATAFYMLGFGQYMTYFFGDLPVATSALVMAGLLVFINYRGVKEASFFQNLIVVGLIAMISVFIAFGVFEVDMSTLKPFNPKGWGAVATLSATLYVSFIGFEVIATSAEEIKEPGVNLPLAMIASVLTPMLLYVLVMFVSTGVLPVDALAESNIPVADVALEAMGEWGSLMMVLGAVLATVSSANASILSAARVNYAMGRDKLFSGWLNEIHSTFHTPYRAIWLTGGIILAMIALGVGIETLADVASFAYLVTYALVHVAVIVMRRADPPEYDPDFRISGAFYPLIPFVGILSTLVILAQMRPLILGIGTGVVGVGVAWYIGYARFHAREISLIGEAIMADTYDETEEEGYKVVVPVANPESERTLLKLAAACARDHDSPQLIAVNVLEVPPQTALSQDVEYEKERVRRQQQLLDQASEIAESLGVSLKTEAVVARDVASAILDVVEREKPDRVMLGWTGKRKRSDFIFGSHVDRIIEGVACEISLVKTSREDIGDVVALAGGGPTSGLAARQAYEIAMSDPESSLTLLNARVTESDNDRDSEEEYQKLRETAEAANIPEDAYEMEVATGTDIEDILIKAVRPFGTICIGATRDGILKQAIQGSLPQKIAEKASGNIFMVNESHRPRTIREAVIETLLREEE